VLGISAAGSALGGCVIGTRSASSGWRKRCSLGAGEVTPAAPGASTLVRDSFSVSAVRDSCEATVRDSREVVEDDAATAISSICSVRDSD